MHAGASSCVPVYIQKQRLLINHLWLPAKARDGQRLVLCFPGSHRWLIRSKSMSSWIDDQSGSISETACFECGIVTGVTMSDYRSAQTMRRSRAVRECRQKGESTSTSKQVPLSRACLTVLRFRLFFHSMPAASQSCLQPTGPAHSRFLPPPAAPPSPPSPVGPRGRKSRAFRQASQAISCIR